MSALTRFMRTHGAPFHMRTRGPLGLLARLALPPIMRATSHVQRQFSSKNTETIPVPTPAHSSAPAAAPTTPSSAVGSSAAGGASVGASASGAAGASGVGGSADPTVVPLFSTAPLDSYDLSNVGVRAQLHERARYHRRARIWLMALFTVVSACGMGWRHLQQKETNERDIEKAKAMLKTAQDELEQAQQLQDDRRQRAQKLLDAVAVGGSSSASGTSAPPSSFLATAVEDVRRTLSLSPADERIILSSNVQHAASTVTAANQQTTDARQAKQKPLIMY